MREDSVNAAHRVSNTSRDQRGGEKKSPEAYELAVYFIGACKEIVIQHRQNPTDTVNPTSQSTAYFTGPQYIGMYKSNKDQADPTGPNP